MSYAISAALQAAVYSHLSADAALAALVGGAIYDAVPAGALPETYVSLGPEEVRDASDLSGAGADHDFAVSVVTTAAGFQTAKTVAVAISDALAAPPPVLTRGRIVALWFLRAEARRTRDGTARRIDMKFRARVEET